MNSENKIFRLKEYETAVEDTSLVSLPVQKQKANLRETTRWEMSEEEANLDPGSFPALVPWTRPNVVINIHPPTPPPRSCPARPAGMRP